MKKQLNKKQDRAVTRNWFDQWSNEYDRTLGSMSFHRALLDLVVKNSNLKKGNKILDIGCGTGLLSLKLLKGRDCLITGVDSSKEMAAVFVDKIKKLGLQDQIGVTLMDVAALKFNDNTFDRIVSSVTLHHLSDKLPALRQIFRILKPGGIFILGEIDMDTTGKHTDVGRLKRILMVLEQEWFPALKDVGVEAFAKMYDNGKKHILNQGEYCLSLEQWAKICRQAGFSSATVKRVPRHPCFGIVIAKKK